MYDEVVKALRMCGYPKSYWYCEHGCIFSRGGSVCDRTPLLSAAASAIDELNERLHDYRTALARRGDDIRPHAEKDPSPDCGLVRDDRTEGGENDGEKV